MKHLKLILKTLVSNSACVEAARTHETKYNVIAIVIAILGVFLAILPNAIKSFQRSGSDWLKSSFVYGIDNGMYKLCEDTKEKIPFTINNKTLSVDQNKWNETYRIKNWDASKENYQGLSAYTYYHDIYETDTRKINFKVLEVYVLTDLEDNKFNEYVSNLLGNLNPTIEKKDNNDKDRYMQFAFDDKGEKIKVERSSSIIAFGKNRVYGYLYRPGTPSAVGSTGGDYNHIENTNDLLAKLFAGHNEIENTFNNWKEFFNKVYLDTRWNSSWTSTGIMIGVDFGVLLFMGLMVWILTRGKNNPFRIYSLWDGQKISYYASLTPAILSLILGFLMSQMAMMFYVLILGVRVMWLSMRTLRYNAPNGGK